MILEGRLAADGTLDGPLRNVTFRGTARHRDGDRPASVAVGLVHLDTRLRHAGRSPPTWPSSRSPSTASAARSRRCKTRGEVRGRFQSEGTLSRLAVNTELTGEIGNIQADGFATLLPPRWGAERLLLRFSRLDLGALTGRDFATHAGGRAPGHRRASTPCARPKARWSWRSPEAGCASG